MPWHFKTWLIMTLYKWVTLFFPCFSCLQYTLGVLNSLYNLSSLCVPNISTNSMCHYNSCFIKTFALLTNSVYRFQHIRLQNCTSASSSLIFICKEAAQHALKYRKIYWKITVHPSSFFVSKFTHLLYLVCGRRHPMIVHLDLTCSVVCYCAKPIFKFLNLPVSHVCILQLEIREVSFADEHAICHNVNS